jgi:hypothetical protein
MSVNGDFGENWQRCLNESMRCFNGDCYVNRASTLEILTICFCNRGYTGKYCELTQLELLPLTTKENNDDHCYFITETISFLILSILIYCVYYFQKISNKTSSNQIRDNEFISSV